MNKPLSQGLALTPSLSFWPRDNLKVEAFKNNDSLGVHSVKEFRFAADDERYAAGYFTVPVCETFEHGTRFSQLTFIYHDGANTCSKVTFINVKITSVRMDLFTAERAEEHITRSCYDSYVIAPPISFECGFEGMYAHTKQEKT